MNEIVHFRDSDVDADCGTIGVLLSEFLAPDHEIIADVHALLDRPSRVTLPINHQGEIPEGYADRAREFTDFIKRREAGMQEEGSEPAAPFGPIGIAHDGTVVSVHRLRNGQINLWTQNLFGRKIESQTWRNPHIDSNETDILVETDSRLCVVSSALGKVTLRRFVPERILGSVRVTRTLDLAAEGYQYLHPHSDLPVIGSISSNNGVIPLIALEGYRLVQ